METITKSIAKLQLESRPIVIWGTKTAARICHLVLKRMNANIVAAGDNHIDCTGRRVYGVPILSLQQIQHQYPNAVIVIGSFFRDTVDAISAQIRSTGNQFAICRFEEIEYLYEIEYLNRNIRDQENLYQVIHNVFYDSACRWERKCRNDIIIEYRYVVRDGKAEDLKEIISRVYGIRKLVLIISTSVIKESEELIDELIPYNHIGHIVAVIEYGDNIPQSYLRSLAAKVFYIVCDENAPTKFLADLEKMGIAVDTKTLPDELFGIEAIGMNSAVTERDVVESVLAYIGEDITRHGGLRSKPVYIVQLSNGLANQMLMYLFGRFVEEESGRIVIFDDTILSVDVADEEENVNRICKWNKGLRRSEVEAGVRITRKKSSFYQFHRAEVAEVFDIPIRLLSDYFDGDTWNRYLNAVKKNHLCRYSQGYPLGQILVGRGFDMTFIRDTIMPDEFLAVRRSCYMDITAWGRPYTEKSITQFMLTRNNAYFDGVWANGKVDDWLIHHRHWVKGVFRFQLNLNERNRRYVKEISESDSVMIHIRRGDFAHFKLAPEIDYFRRSIEQVEKTMPSDNRRYFIFSDDLEWCWEHRGELGIEKLGDITTFVTGNTGVWSYMDLYLMSLGKIIIATPGSSFSYMAILLSGTVEKYICVSRYVYELLQGEEAVPQLTDV